MQILTRPSKGLIFAVLNAFLWACVLVDSRYLLSHGESSLNLTTWLSLFLVLPWLIVLFKHRKEARRLSTKTVFLLIVIGIAGSIGINLLQALALANTSAINFAFLYRTIVIFTIVFAWIFFKEKLTITKGILVIIVLIGSYLLTTNGKGISLSLGDIYTLAMAASAAFIANILIKHTVAKMHPDLSGSTISLVTALSLFLLALFSGVLKTPQHILLVLLGSGISFFQIMSRNRAYKFATASFVTMIACLTPLFVALLSYPLLHESLDAIELIGGGVIVVATILVEKFEI